MTLEVIRCYDRSSKDFEAILYEIFLVAAVYERLRMDGRNALAGGRSRPLGFGTNKQCAITVSRKPYDNLKDVYWFSRWVQSFEMQLQDEARKVVAMCGLLLMEMERAVRRCQCLAVLLACGSAFDFQAD